MSASTLSQLGARVEHADLLPLFADEFGAFRSVYQPIVAFGESGATTVIGYEALLRAGVRIFQFESPTILHAKHFTIDEQVSVIGSSNMDMRSFSLNYEISVMLHGRDIVTKLREIEDTYRQQCTELLLDDWLTRPLRSKVLDNTARLTAAVQ